MWMSTFTACPHFTEKNISEPLLIRPICAIHTTYKCSSFTDKIIWYAE